MQEGHIPLPLLCEADTLRFIVSQQSNASMCATDRCFLNLPTVHKLIYAKLLSGFGRFYIEGSRPCACEPNAISV